MLLELHSSMKGTCAQSADDLLLFIGRVVSKAHGVGDWCVNTCMVLQDWQPMGSQFWKKVSGAFSILLFKRAQHYSLLSSPLPEISAGHGPKPQQGAYTEHC